MNHNLQNAILENKNFQILNNYEVINPVKSMLVSKKIESYFDDLVKIPEITQTAGNKEFSFSKFYSEYIEHNILLLFIILCLVIFLIVKYINKNYYNDNNNDNNNYENFNKNSNKLPKNNNKSTVKFADDDYNNETDEIEDDDDIQNTTAKKLKEKLTKQKLLKIKKETERERHLLELEKQSILDIIDELSNINYEKIQTNNQVINNQVINHKNSPKINHYENSNNNYYGFPNNDMYIDREDYLNENQSNFSQYSLIESNDLGSNNDYYTLKRNINYKDKKSPNYIKGMYIESPFEE